MIDFTHFIYYHYYLDYHIYFSLVQDLQFCWYFLKGLVWNWSGSGLYNTETVLQYRMLSNKRAEYKVCVYLFVTSLSATNTSSWVCERVWTTSRCAEVYQKQLFSVSQFICYSCGHLSPRGQHRNTNSGVSVITAVHLQENWTHMERQRWRERKFDWFSDYLIHSFMHAFQKSNRYILYPS